jgi:hypothetical protein
LQIILQSQVELVYNVICSTIVQYDAPGAIRGLLRSSKEFLAEK